MNQAQKIQPMSAASKTQTLKAIDKALAPESRTVLSRLRSISPQNLLLATLTVGLLATVNEVNRQRKAVAKVQETSEAVVQYVRVMIDETNCGGEAYTYLQVMAEEEEATATETIAKWAPEDTEPVPYVPAEHVPAEE